MSDYTRSVEEDALIIRNQTGETILRIEEKMENESAAVLLYGSIPLDLAHDFEDELIAVISTCNDVTLDCSDLKFISHTAMESLLNVQKAMEQKTEASCSLLLKGLSETVNQIFEETGFSDLFEIKKA